MALVNGTDITLRYSGQVIARLTSNDFNLTSEILDTTSKDDAGWRTILPAKKSFNFSAEGFYEEKPNAPTKKYYEDLYDALIAGTALTVRIGGTAAGTEYYEGIVYVSNITLGAPVEDTTTYSVTLEGSGALTKGTN